MSKRYEEIAKLADVTGRLIRRTAAVHLRDHPGLSAAVVKGRVSATGGELLANVFDDATIEWAIEPDSAKERRQRMGQLRALAAEQGHRPGLRPNVILVCTVCAREFSAHRHDRKFCSNACRQAAHRLPKAAPPAKADKRARR
jgi:hypothetical protein